VLVEFGNTKVICTASVESGVPSFLKGSGQGWITAEYGMLPRSTGRRMRREATQSKQGGRTVEIQRLIGRSLRAAVDMKQLGEVTIIIDCDVIQADGGTRTASITGGYVALVQAVTRAREQGLVKTDPINTAVASVSVGICDGEPVLLEDDEVTQGPHAGHRSEEGDQKGNPPNSRLGGRSRSEASHQRTAGHPFSAAELESMLGLARHGIDQLFHVQKEALGRI